MRDSLSDLRSPNWGSSPDTIFEDVELVELKPTVNDSQYDPRFPQEAQSDASLVSSNVIRAPAGATPPTSLDVQRYLSGKHGLLKLPNEVITMILAFCEVQVVLTLERVRMLCFLQYVGLTNTP